MIMIIEIEK